MHRAILFTLTFVSAVSASPQWLQYRTSERSQDIIGGSSAFNRPEKEKPNIALPAFACDAPIFIKWQTPMDPAGFRWAAFDRKSKFGSYLVFYFDTNGNGRLDDDAGIEGRQMNEYEVEFGKVPVLFGSEDGPITYHLNVRFMRYNEDSTYAYLYSGCWYEGQVEIDGQKQRCVLVDYNVNGTFDDKSADFSADRIGIGPEGSELAYVGNYLEYKDKLYRPLIARDGAFVELTPAADVAYGTVTIPKEITEFSAGGLNGMYTRQVADGKVSLPEGDYRIYHWTITRKDSKGAEWRMEGSAPSSNVGRFKVAKDISAELTRIGEPVFSKLEVSDRDGSFYFNQALAGQLGERINLYRSNRQAPAPQIHIRNKTGEYDRTLALEYG